MRKNTNFLIAQKDNPSIDDQLFWNAYQNKWVTYEYASTFDKDILKLPLPPGAYGVLEFDIDNCPVGDYPLPHIGGTLKKFTI